MNGVVPRSDNTRSFYDLVSHGEVRQIVLRVANAVVGIFKASRNFVWDKSCILKERVIALLPERLVFSRAPEREFLKFFLETPEGLRRDVISALLAATEPEMEAARKEALTKEFIEYPRGDKIVLKRNILSLFSKMGRFFANQKVLNVIKSMPTPAEKAQLMLSLIPEAVRMSSDTDDQNIAELARFFASFSHEARQELVGHPLLIRDPEGMMGHTLVGRIQLMTALVQVPREERLVILGFVGQILPRFDNMTAYTNLMKMLKETPAAERETLIQYALQLITQDMGPTDRLNMVRNIRSRPADQRAGHVLLYPLMGVVAPEPVAEGIDVHAGNRDAQTRRAIELLRLHQGEVSQRALNAAILAFQEYLNALEMDPGVKSLVQDALLKPREEGEPFGPLLNGVVFSIRGLGLFGEEILGRLWIFASHLAEPEQTNAKLAMVAALRDSYEFGERVCNPGKTQRLLVAVLQGRLEGVLIDATASERITVHQAIQMFFNVPARQQIAIREELIVEAGHFCDQNPLIEREAFLAEINAYADA